MYNLSYYYLKLALYDKMAQCEICIHLYETNRHKQQQPLIYNRLYERTETKVLATERACTQMIICTAEGIMPKHRTL